MSSKLLSDFTHVKNFTEYMEVVESLIRENFNKKLKILDIPAGNGLLSDVLRKLGHEVISADFNEERLDFDYVNMEQKLPYKSSAFDLIVCLEGIEHVVEPYALIKEFSRITKSDGAVIISMPNVQSMYSRLKFLFTGTFYQFEPEGSKHTNGKPIDRGHISSLSLVQLSYLFGEVGFSLLYVSGDKIKKKVLFPIYLIIMLANKLNGVVKRRTGPVVYGYLNNSKCMLSRSLVTVWSKNHA